MGLAKRKLEKIRMAKRNKGKLTSKHIYKKHKEGKSIKFVQDKITAKIAKTINHNNAQTRKEGVPGQDNSS